MAERNRTNPLIRAALLLIVGVSAGGFAQSPGGSVRIQLTDLYAKPLTGASVTLRNRTTGALSQTIAAKGGVYRCAGLEPGEYTLDASSPSQGSASLHGIEVTAGQEAHVLAAIELAPAPRLTSDARRPETEPREPGYTLLPPPKKVEGERLAPRITRAEGDQPPPASRPAPELALLPRIPEAAVASLAGRNPAQAFLPALAPALAHEGANAPAIAMPPAQAMLRALPQVPKPAIEIAESVPDGASPPATLPAAAAAGLAPGRTGLAEPCPRGSHRWRRHRVRRCGAVARFLRRNGGRREHCGCLRGSPRKPFTRAERSSPGTRDQRSDDSHAGDGIRRLGVQHWP